MVKRSFRVNKLIRDHLPDLLIEKGIVLHQEVMAKETFLKSLKDKLIEEANEVSETDNLEDLTEELADVLEVVYSLSANYGISLQKIEEKRQAKKVSKGGFNKQVFCHTMDLAPDNPLIEYYLQKANSYPEIKNSTDNHECIFCRFPLALKNEIFATFKHCYVVLDQYPVSKGHLLIIPYEHIDNWFLSSKEIQLEMIDVLNLMREKIDLLFAPHGYNIGLNCGKAAGQTIMHLHLHLIPRYEGDMEDPRGGIRGAIPNKQNYH